MDSEPYSAAAHSLAHSCCPQLQEGGSTRSHPAVACLATIALPFAPELLAFAPERPRFAPRGAAGVRASTAAGWLMLASASPASSAVSFGAPAKCFARFAPACAGGARAPSASFVACMHCEARSAARGVGDDPTARGRVQATDGAALGSAAGAAAARASALVDEPSVSSARCAPAADGVAAEGDECPWPGTWNSRKVCGRARGGCGGGCGQVFGRKAWSRLGKLVHRSNRPPSRASRQRQSAMAR